MLGPSGPAYPRRSEAGELWQERFPSLGSGQAFDHALRTVKDYWETVEYIHLNPVGKGLMKRPQDWSPRAGSSYNNFSLEKAVVAACPIQIDYVRLPEGYRR